MNPFAALFFKLARRLIPRTTRMRLNKYRGPGLATRIRLGGSRNPTVLSGPFKGLRYPAYGIGSEYFPKLLGTYELELHPALANLATEAFSTLIIVGAGEGYYVGGLARIFPEARIVSFEGDPEGQAAVAEMAMANGFHDRLDNRAFCGPDDLRAALPSSGRTLLVMDVEGGERQLLAPEDIPALAGSTIVVEVHDCFEPGLDDLLRQRFQATHHCEDIPSRPRTLEDTRSLSPGDAEDASLLPLMDEVRPARMRWFVLTPRP